MGEMAIKNNVCGGNHFCAVCGGATQTDFGPDLFLEGTEQIVCHECGRDHAPELVGLLDLARQAARFCHDCAR
jgi:hypothetical protein